MSLRYSNVELLPQKHREQAKTQLGWQKKRKPKHNNVKVTDTETGELIDSKLEAEHRGEYRQQGRAGQLLGYASGTQLFLPGGIEMRPDHLLIDSVTDDGRVIGRLVDSKGRATSDWRNKQKLAASLGIEVTARGK